MKHSTRIKCGYTYPVVSRPQRGINGEWILTIQTDDILRTEYDYSRNDRPQDGFLAPSASNYDGQGESRGSTLFETLLFIIVVLVIIAAFSGKLSCAASVLDSDRICASYTSADSTTDLSEDELSLDNSADSGYILCIHRSGAGLSPVVSERIIGD